MGKNLFKILCVVLTAIASYHLGYHEAYRNEDFKLAHQIIDVCMKSGIAKDEAEKRIVDIENGK